MMKSASVIGTKLERWLLARGLEPELAASLGFWSAAAKGDNQFVPDADGDWLAIPYAVDGEVVSHKYRRIDRKGFSQDRGAGGHLWNEDVIRDPALAEKTLVITEGEMDALAVIQAGWPKTVSVPAGAPEREDRLDFLDPVVDIIRTGKFPIVIASDRDRKGAVMLRVLSARLGPARCKLVRYPEGCKDFNDVLREHGVGAVRDVLRAAEFVPVSGLLRNSEMPPSPPLTIWRPEIAPALDDILPICPGQWSVWTGKPGEGKTTVTQAVFLDILDRYGLTAAWFSEEKDMGGAFREEVAAWLARSDFPTPEDHARAADWLEKHVIFMHEPTGREPLTMDWYLDRAETAIIRYGCRLLILDPWSSVEHEYDTRRLNETQYIGRALAETRRVARDGDAHIAIIAHPYKIPGEREADGYSISGSAHWFNKTFLGVTISRHDPEDGTKRRDWPTKVRTWKIKDHKRMGYPGEALVKLGPGGRFLPYTLGKEMTRENSYPV